MAEDGSDLDEVSQGSGERKSIGRRWTKVLLWTLVVVELLWLAAGNAFLRTSWGPFLLGQRPEKLQITWESAWTPLPGVVRIHRLDVRGRSPKVTWMASADSAWAWIAPLDLVRRCFHVRWLDADGLETRVRMERKDPEGQPTIDGFEGLPEPVRKPKKHHWRLHFDRVSVDGIRELWIGPLQYVSRPDSSEDGGTLVGFASGKVQAEVRGEVSVPRAKVELGPGRAVAGSEVIGTVTRLAFDGRLHPFVPSEVKGLATLGAVSGTFEAATVGGSLGLVDYFFRGAPASVRGTGRLDTTLHVDRGVLQPESRLTVDGGSVAVSYLGWRGEGDGALEGEVLQTGETQLAVILDEIDVGLDRVAESLVTSRGARLLATADRFDLSVRTPALKVVADLPDAQVKELAKLQPFLPAHAKVELLGGSGSLTAHGELTTLGSEQATSGLNAQAKGWLKIRGDAIDVKIQGHAFVTDLVLDLEVPRGDLGLRRLDLNGSRLQLRNVQAPDVSAGGSKPWWADLRVPKGSVHLPENGSIVDSRVDAEVRADLADSRPVLALVRERRKGFRWLDKMLTFENLELKGEFRTRGDSVELRDLRVHDRAEEGVDKQLQILGQLRFGETGYDTLLRASMKAPVGHVAAGLRVQNGKIRDVDLRHSLEWYQEQSEAFWAP